MRHLFIWLLFFLAFDLHSQSFTIRDYYGNIVNDDTVAVIFHPDGNHGWTELSIPLYIQNTSGTVKTLSVKKTEFGMDPDEYHAICFGGTCFDSSTFISPFKDPVAAGAIDSTFSGHYRFDDLLHKKGKRYVAYTFYDEDKQDDSSIVYVEYNTMVKEGASADKQLFFLGLSPNPAQKDVHLEFKNNKGGLKKISIILMNSTGEYIWSGETNANLQTEILSIENYPAGIYHVLIFSDNIFLSGTKLIIR
jgi:hypothetical protein